MDRTRTVSMHLNLIAFEGRVIGRVRTFGHVSDSFTLTTQEKILAHGTLIARVFLQWSRVTGEHGTTKVDSVA